MLDLPIELDTLEKKYMYEAFKLALQARDADEVPVGAIIVKDGKIVAKAHNQVETLKDPTAHAEMIAITQAANTLSSKWLNGCDVYVTIEPCSMCAGALVLARIKRLYIGAMDKKAGACGSVMNIVRNKGLNHIIDVETGVLKDQCRNIISNYFKQKR